MPFFAAIPRAAAAAAAVLLCGALLAAGREQTVHLGDEVTLLQAGATTKAQQRAGGTAAAAAATATSAAKGVAEAEKAAAKADLFCETEPSVTAVRLPAREVAAAAEDSVAADAQEALGQPADVAGEQVEAPPSRSALAGVLEVLIVLIVLDGFRRWQSMRTEEQKAGQKTGGKAPKEASESYDGWGALMQAALAGDAPRAQKALRGVPFAELSHADVWGCTALHAAAKGGCAEVVRMLLERGATVHDRDAWDETPLHLAARAGEAGACETLIAFGADVDALNAQDWTPLVVAAEGGHKPLCSMLLARGAGVAGLPRADLPFLLRGLLGRGGEREEEEEEEEDEQADYSEEVLCY